MLSWRFAGRASVRSGSRRQQLPAPQRYPPMRLLLLFAFLPTITLGATAYPSGMAGWETASNAVAASAYLSIAQQCRPSTNGVLLARSHSQNANYRCEIARTITHACISYAQQAGTMRMLDRIGYGLTPALLWRLIMQENPSIVGSVSAWESSTYAPKTLTAGDLYWNDYNTCMAHYRP